MSGLLERSKTLNDFSHIQSEKNQLVSLIWNLREQLDRASSENLLLQQQRTQLGIKIQHLQKNLVHNQIIINNYKNFIKIMAFNLVIAILCWIKQRKYSKALVYKLKSLDNNKINNINDYIYKNNNKIDNQSSYNNNQENKLEDNILISSPEKNVKSNQVQSLLSQKIHIGGKKINSKSSQNTTDKNLLSNNNNKIDNSNNINDNNNNNNNINDNKGSLIVDISVLHKIQQLRLELEDFQAILKLNESPFHPNSPLIKSPITKKKPPPDYLKHRRTNSKNMRNSFELP